MTRDSKITALRLAPTPDDGGDAPLGSIQDELARLAASGEGGATDTVDAVLTHAARHGASDVHFEPWEDCLAVRFRIDGLLHDVARLPSEHHARLAARLKVLARIPVYHKDLPRDGRIERDATPCGRAMRVSTFPTVSGEKLVVRILDSDHRLLRLDELGFTPETVGTLRRLIERPQGTILLTGPSSSGKTTTIYALLRELAESRRPAPHIATIEDPVEYRLGRISQSEINAPAGFTYDAALRSVLRQDPEVIMLGEIRDPETARTAIQAGLTGHRVISTIHSGTAAGVFTRLLEMGVEPYLVASSVSGVLAQRLVRRICPDCRTADTACEPLRERFGLDPDVALARGAGCPACRGIGYRGRTALAEALTVDETFAETILARSRTSVLHEAAARGGMVPLTADGLRKAREGATTLEELLRVLPAADKPETTRATA